MPRRATITIVSEQIQPVGSMEELRELECERSFAIDIFRDVKPGYIYTA